MPRTIDPQAVEKDRVRKRITVPISASDAAHVTSIAAHRGVPSSRVVAKLISDGMMMEQQARLRREAIEWPPREVAPRYVQAAFSPYDLLDLIEIAETAFEPLNYTASSLFKLGLQKYLHGDQK